MRQPEGGCEPAAAQRGWARTASEPIGTTEVTELTAEPTAEPPPTGPAPAVSELPPYLVSSTDGAGTPLTGTLLAGTLRAMTQSAVARSARPRPGLT